MLPSLTRSLPSTPEGHALVSPQPGTRANTPARLISRDAKFDANMKRIAKIYENSSLSEDQKVELLFQMETEAKREINELNSEISQTGTEPQ